MIKLQQMTPEVYYNQSRDFQFIGRLYDLILNSVKTNTDLIYNIPISENSDERLIDLMSMTLGFKSKHNYNIKQLTALCTSFIEIIKNKGNIQAIEKAINALTNAEGLTENCGYNIDYNEHILTIFVSPELSDTNLIKDLFAYILPAGMSVRINKSSIIKGKQGSSEFFTEDDVLFYKENNNIGNNATNISKLPLAASINGNYHYGYYDSTNEKFYRDSAYKAEISPVSGDIYIDKTKTAETSFQVYIYNEEKKTYELVSNKYDYYSANPHNAVGVFGQSVIYRPQSTSISAVTKAKTTRKKKE